jgi:hypothetical protein
MAASLAQTTDAGWTTYKSNDGKFSVVFPIQPEESSSVDKSVTLHTYKVLQRPRIYIVIYSDYPDADLALDTATRIKAERDGFVKGLTNATVIAERQFSFKRGNSELPALEFTSETATVTYKSLIILDGRRVYFVCAGSIKGNDSAAQFERFLGSFALN